MQEVEQSNCVRIHMNLYKMLDEAKKQYRGEMVWMVCLTILDCSIVSLSLVFRQR